METESFLVNSLHFITVVAVPLHIFGTYCILFKTPKSMGSVKWVMINLHGWCMLLDYGVTILTVPFLLLPVMGGYPLGILRYYGVPTYVQTFLIEILLAKVNVAILTVFENRFYQIFAKNTIWRRLRYFLLMFNHLYAIFWGLPEYFFIPEQSWAIQQAIQMLPQRASYFMDDAIFILAIDWHIVVFSTFTMAFIYFFEAMIFNVLMFRGMKIMMRKNTSSKNTIQVQKRFLYAIYVQTIVYGISLQGPVVWACIAVIFEIHNQAFNNMCFILFASHGPISTVVMLISHKPYRIFCSNIVNLFTTTVKEKIVSSYRETGTLKTVRFRETMKG